MSDIVDRLVGAGQTEAADEIVRLRKAVLELCAAIRSGSRSSAMNAAATYGPRDFVAAALVQGFHEIDKAWREVK